MILTVTMNPSIDMSYPIEHLKIDDVNRVKHVSKTAGGKGLNVTRVIHMMGHAVTATGILGGNFGKFIEDKLDEDNTNHDFMHIDQESRNSIAILHDGGNQTELLESGPTISKADAEAFLTHFRALLTHTDLVTISGSLPGGLPADYYAKMITIAAQEGVDVLLDASGDALKAGIEGSNKPLLIKPNDEELGALLNQKVDRNDTVQLKQLLQADIFDDIEWIVVSLGSKGAFIKHWDKCYQAKIPKIKVVNPVGSGDSTLAGLALALDGLGDDVTVMSTAMTTGMLNTMEAQTGYVNASLFDEYFSRVEIVPV